MNALQIDKNGEDMKELKRIKTIAQPKKVQEFIAQRRQSRLKKIQRHNESQFETGQQEVVLDLMNK